MSVHHWPWIMGLAAFTAAGVTACTQPVRLAGPAPRSHPASISPAAASGAPSSPSGPEPPGPAAVPVCPARQLKIRMIYGGPAAGTVGGVLGLTNQGREACRLAWLAGPGGSRSLGADQRGPHPRRLRRAGAGPPARRDDQARRAGRSGADRCGCTRARADHLPAALPAAARHPARPVTRLGNLGMDSALRRLPARVPPGVDLARDTPLPAPLPPARPGELTAAAPRSEETARHAGHPGAARELLDGRTGLGPGSSRLRPSGPPLAVLDPHEHRHDLHLALRVEGPEPGHGFLRRADVRQGGQR